MMESYRVGIGAVNGQDTEQAALSAEERLKTPTLPILKRVQEIIAQLKRIDFTPYARMTSAQKGAHAGYRKIQEMMRRVVAGAILFADQGADLLDEIARGIHPTGGNWLTESALTASGIRAPADITSSRLAGYATKVRELRERMAAYLAAGGSAENLRAAALQLMESAQLGFAIMNAYRDTLYYKVMQLMAKVEEILDAILGFLGKAARAAKSLIDWLPWIAAGTGLLIFGPRIADWVREKRETRETREVSS